MKDYIVTLPNTFDSEKHVFTFLGQEVPVRPYSDKYERAIEALSKMNTEDFKDKFGNGCRGLPIDEIVKILIADKDRKKVEMLAAEIGIHKLYSIVKEMRGE